MSGTIKNLCVACKHEMPVIPEGLWMFRNEPFSLIIRLITKNEKQQVESHQICMSCIKSIVANLKEPELSPPAESKIVCLPNQPQ